MAEIARREMHLHRHVEELREEGLDMRPRLLDRLLVGLGDIGRRGPADLGRRRRIAVLPLGHLAIHVEVARDRGERAVGLEIDVAPVRVRGPLDGLGRALGGAPDRRVRLLVGAGPEVHVFEVIVPALERERAFLGPGADDQLMRLLVPGQRLRRVAAHRVVLGADAAHEAGDQPSLGDAVDHRVLFGERQRVLAEAEGVAEDGDLRLRRAARERGGHHHRGRHQPVGVLVVLVDAKPVESRLLAIFELVEIAVVESMSGLRVEQAIGQHHPRRLVLRPLCHVEDAIGHQVEREDLHLYFLYAGGCRITPPCASARAARPAPSAA